MGPQLHHRFQCSWTLLTWESNTMRIRLSNWNRSTGHPAPPWSHLSFGARRDCGRLPSPARIRILHQLPLPDITRCPFEPPDTGSSGSNIHFCWGRTLPSWTSGPNISFGGAKLHRSRPVSAVPGIRLLHQLPVGATSLVVLRIRGIPAPPAPTSLSVGAGRYLPGHLAPPSVSVEPDSIINVRALPFSVSGFFTNFRWGQHHTLSFGIAGF